MSTNQTFRPGASTGPVKSKQYVKKNAESLYKRSFGDLPDGTIYRDPCGWKAGESITLQKDRFEQLAREPVAGLESMVAKDEQPTVLNAWNAYQERGFTVAETTKQIRKSLDTGDWTLPLDILPDIFVVNPEQLPMADMMARVTTQDDEVVPTPLTAHPSISHGLETTTDQEGSYTYSDPTYDSTVSYDVLGYGAATRLEDKLILASSNLRNAESSQEEAFMRAMRQEEERQIILGTDNNSNGFDGLNDFISSGEGDNVTTVDIDTSGTPSDFEAATRDIIDSAEYEGAPRENLAVVCGFDWHKEVRKSLVSQQRFDGNVTEVGAGFEAMTLDNVPVMKSHAISRYTDRGTDVTNRQAYTVNMEAHYLAMLQEPQLKPLAKVAPQEQFAVDAYGALVAEDDGAHVQAAQVETAA